MMLFVVLSMIVTSFRDVVVIEVATAITSFHESFWNMTRISLVLCFMFLFIDSYWCFDALDIVCLLIY